MNGTILVQATYNRVLNGGKHSSEERLCFRRSRQRDTYCTDIRLVVAPPSTVDRTHGVVHRLIWYYRSTSGWRILLHDLTGVDKSQPLCPVCETQ